MENPWQEYYLRNNKNKFHPRDEKHALAFNSAIKGRKNYELADHLEPFPYLGNPNAPVIVLLANPGKSSAEEKKSFKYSPRKLELHKQNLLHNGSEDFVLRLDSPEDRNLESPYFKSRTARLVEVSSIESVANNLFFINFHGYHSRSWYPIPFTFYTQNYSFSLVKKAIMRGSHIVMSRNTTGWLTAVPELVNYPNKCLFKSTRSVHMSENNLGAKDYKKILSLIN